MKPLLLVDVDGVLNPNEAKPTRRPEDYDTYYKTYYDECRGKQGKMRVWLNKEHGPMLTQWAKRMDFELAWCTTWGEDANTWIAPKIGLDTNLPVVHFYPEELRDQSRWKYLGVERFAEDRSLVWLDDDFRYFRSARDRFHLSRSRYANTAMWQIDPKVGLLQTDLDDVARYVVTEWQSF